MTTQAKSVNVASDEMFFDNLIKGTDLQSKLSISKATMHRWCQRGAPHIRIGKLIYFQKKEIVTWIRSNGSAVNG
jgi:predicted DNA-binding transcriptional regulator AlpA